jgi:hypothetical protein
MSSREYMHMANQQDKFRHLRATSPTPKPLAILAAKAATRLHHTCQSSSFVELKYDLLQGVFKKEESNDQSRMVRLIQKEGISPTPEIQVVNRYTLKRCQLGVTRASSLAYDTRSSTCVVNLRRSWRSSAETTKEFSMQR